jgi:hypothetical protein
LTPLLQVQQLLQEPFASNVYQTIDEHHFKQETLDEKEISFAETISSIAKKSFRH